jgi:uncharacterized protein
MRKADINERDVTGATKLFEAVSSRNFTKVEKLLDAGADPNIPENNGTTPVMEAAGWGSLRLIRLLVRYKANVRARDNFGDSALDYAAKQKHPKAVQLLKDLAEQESSS